MGLVESMRRLIWWIAARLAVAASIVTAGGFPAVARANAGVDVQLTVVFLGGGQGTLSVQPPGSTYNSGTGEVQDSFDVSAGTVITLRPQPAPDSFFDGFQSGGYCGATNIYGYYESWSCQAEPSGNPGDPGSYSNQYLINVGANFEQCPQPGTYEYGQGGITQGADTCPGVTVEGVPSGPLQGGVTATQNPTGSGGPGPTGPIVTSVVQEDYKTLTDPNAPSAAKVLVIASWLPVGQLGKLARPLAPLLKGLGARAVALLGAAVASGLKRLPPGLKQKLLAAGQVFIASSTDVRRAVAAICKSPAAAGRIICVRELPRILIRSADLKHILDGHAFRKVRLNRQGVLRAGELLPGNSNPGKLLAMINETVGRGVAQPNTQNRPGTVFRHCFAYVVGWVQGSRPSRAGRTMCLRVIVQYGFVITAFPVR